VVTPSIATVSINMAMWAALATCAVSVVAAGYLSFFDWKAENIVRPGEDEPEIAFPRFSDVRELPGTVWYLAFITLFYYVSVFVWVQYAMYVIASMPNGSCSSGILIRAMSLICGAYHT